MSAGMPPWAEEFPGAVTVSAMDGTILYMNEKASEAFANRGGREALVGRNLASCHKEESNAVIQALMDEKKANAYTIAKGGKSKFIYQAPWYEGGELRGLVELSMEIPAELPHFDRG
jgi:hypothetical protein